MPDNAPPAAIESLFAELEGGVGYVRIPSMWSPSDQPLFFKRLEEKLEAFRAGKALVLDIRHNGGGTRDILMTLAPYIVHPDSSPWVGNVAHVRMTNPPQAGTIIDGMDGRYLFQRGDKRLSKADRAAIARFRKAFKPKWKFDTSRFSEPHFLILRSPGTPPGASETAAPRHLGVPVYVLMNERCFSAASVFAAALKGVKGVTLVGVRTDGSSGRSARVRLGGTGMELKLSTMISFQRDGLTLDGNGTAPDVEIAPDLDQVLGKRDTQLERLLDLIHR